MTSGNCPSGTTQMSDINLYICCPNGMTQEDGTGSGARVCCVDGKISTIDLLHIRLIKNRRKLPYGAAGNSILR